MDPNFISFHALAFKVENKKILKFWFGRQNNKKRKRCCLQNKTLNHGAVKDVVVNGPIAKLIKLRCDNSRPLMAVWFLLRSVFIILIIVTSITEPVLYQSNLDHGTELKHCGHHILLSWNADVTVAILFLCFTVCILVYDFRAFLHMILSMPRWVRKEHLSWTKPRVASHYFYRFTQFAYLISTVILCLAKIIYLLLDEYEIMSVFTNEVFIVVCIFGAVWSILFFVQLIPKFGYFVLSMQRMLSYFVQVRTNSIDLQLS